MRADRLVALLLMLQRRGTVTAAEAAEELEVSLRTARRDFEALSASGVPVYSQAGRGGGWRLLGGGSTDLSGLTANEARAVFVAAGRSLDAHPNLRSALRKLAAALPEPFQSDAESAAATIRFDDAGWGRDGDWPPPPMLDPVTDAVIEGRRLRIEYQSPRSGSSEREISPLGLISKRGTWYLLAMTDDGRRTFRVDRITDATPAEGPVERPTSFALDEAWNDVVADVETLRLVCRLQAIIEPQIATPMRWYFGRGFQIDERRNDGRLKVTLSANGSYPMAAQIGPFIAAMELIDAPSDVVDLLRKMGRELSAAFP